MREPDGPTWRHRGPMSSVTGLGLGAFASAGYDGAVATIDLITREFRLLGHHDHLVNKVVSDPSGRWVVSCSSDHTLALWDITTGHQVWRQHDHTDDVEAFVFLGNGLGASAGRDHRVVVRDLRSGDAVRELVGHDRDVLTLAAAAGVLISAGDDRTMRAWDPTTGALLETWGPFTHESDSCAIDPVRRRAALGSEDGVIRVVSLDSGQLIASNVVHQSAVKALAFTADGDVLSAGYDQTIQIGSVEDRLEPRQFLTAPAGLWERTLTTTAEGAIIGGTFDGTMLYWPSASSEPQPLGLGDDALGNVCMNDVASLHGVVAVAADDGVVRTLDRCPEGTLRLQATGVPQDRALLNAVAIDPTSHDVLVGSHDQTVQRWSRAGQTLVRQAWVDLRCGPINSIAVLADGRLLVATYSGEVLELAGDLRICRRHRFHVGPVKAVRLHPNGTLAATCSADGSVVVWDIATGSVVERLRGSGPIMNDIAFSPSGRRVSVVGRDFALTTFSPFDGEPQATVLLGHRSLKSVLHLNDDVVLVGDYWGGVTIVDLAAGTSDLREIGLNGISAMTITDGRPLAVSYDGGLYELSVDANRLHETRFMDQRPPRTLAASSL